MGIIIEKPDHFTNNKSKVSTVISRFLIRNKKPSPFRSRPNHGNCCAKTKADPGAVRPKHNFRDTTLLAGRMAGHSFAARCKPGERALITVGTGCDYCAETPRFTEAAHRGWPARSLLPSRTTGGFLETVLRGSRVLFPAFD